MREVEAPEVFLISEPMIRVGAMLTYLRKVGGESWFNRVFGREAGKPPSAELLVEFMGRLCYKSWEPGLNKNVTKVREDRGEYLLNVLRSGHGSVLTHANFSFVIHEGSRVFTAEMNRHAVGTAISEQSLRYVRLDDIPFWMPPGLKPDTEREGRELLDKIEGFIGRAIEREFSDDMEFAQKKVITSKLRRFAPLGLGTEEGWTGNVRAIRHVIEMRTDRHAEEEIRIVADQIATIMQKRCPLLFGDYTLDESVTPPDWQTDYRKV